MRSIKDTMQLFHILCALSLRQHRASATFVCVYMNNEHKISEFIINYESCFPICRNSMQFSVGLFVFSANTYILVACFVVDAVAYYSCTALYSHSGCQCSLPLPEYIQHKCISPSRLQNNCEHFAFALLSGRVDRHHRYPRTILHPIVLGAKRLCTVP